MKIVRNNLFPRLPRILDKRIKVSLEQIVSIKRLRLNGLSERGIGRILKLSQSTVHYYLCYQRNLELARIRDKKRRQQSTEELRAIWRKSKNRIYMLYSKRREWSKNRYLILK